MPHRRHRCHFHNCHWRPDVPIALLTIVKVAPDSLRLGALLAGVTGSAYAVSTCWTHSRRRKIGENPRHGLVDLFVRVALFPEDAGGDTPPDELVLGPIDDVDDDGSLVVGVGARVAPARPIPVTIAPVGPVSQPYPQQVEYIRSCELSDM